MTPIKLTFLQRHFHEIEQGNQDVQPIWELTSAITAQSVTGVGLLITAVVQTSKKQLSLYHAYLIINLLFLLSTSFLYFLFHCTSCVHIYIRVWQMILGELCSPSTMVLSHLVFLAVFSLHVGLKARTFGSQPDCNNTVKIVWLPCPASFTWFRRFRIAIYITLAVIHGVQLIFFRNWVLGLASSKAFCWHGLVMLV